MTTLFARRQARAAFVCPTTNLLYVAWPREQVEDWALGFHELAMQSGILNRDLHADEQQFLQWFDLMGVQRHLKAIGIFSRLNHRDNKPGYLQDIPRTLDYVDEVAGRYPKLQPLQRLIVEQVRPALDSMSTASS